MSESQERMCAVVEPSKVARFMEICAKWDVNATVIGEVTDTQRLEIFWRGELVVDVPPRTVAHEGPVYDRPVSRPADLDALNADDANALAAPVFARRASGNAAATRRVAEPGRQGLGHRPVRPLRHGQHGAGDSPRRWRRAHRRIEPARHRARTRRQRPLRPPRPLLRRAARIGRGVSQRRRNRGTPPRHHRLPELRLARRPRGDVAVHRGDPWHRRWLPRPRHPGHRRQRELLQPDRRHADQPHAGDRRARCDRRCAHPSSDRLWL